jgi:hypothetical protein
MWLKAHSEGNELKLTWGAGDWPCDVDCAVALDRVKAAADGVRRELTRLSQWTQSADPATLPGVLKAIAREGWRLRYTLFDDTRSGMGELKAWIQQQCDGADDVLNVVAEPGLNVPWCLVYDVDPSGIADGAHGPDDFNGFWCRRFRLATVLRGSRPADGTLTRPRKTFRLLSVLNRDVYSAAMADLGGATAQFNELLDRPVGRAFTLEHCDQLVEEAVATDTLFHFLGHGTHNALDLGGGTMIDSIKLSMIMDRLTDRGGGRLATSSLLFLNACETGTGNGDDTLRSAAARPGICGYIATESIVPRDYAARFGLAFLRALLVEGKSVGEAMKALRDDPGMWPLSLLYACHAYPDYRIASA